MGANVSLNSDDPPFFQCTVGGEYELAKSQFGLSDDDFIDKGKPQPKPEIQKQEEGGNKIMSRICKLFSRK